ARAGEPGFDAIAPSVRELINDGDVEEPGELDEKEYLPRLSTLAKFLPSVVVSVSASDGPSRADAEEALERLTALIRKLTREGVGIGTEASLLQGFKRAASLENARALDDRLIGTV